MVSGVLVIGVVVRAVVVRGVVVFGVVGKGVVVDGSGVVVPQLKSFHGITLPSSPQYVP